MVIKLSLKKASSSFDRSKEDTTFKLILVFFDHKSTAENSCT